MNSIDIEQQLKGQNVPRINGSGQLIDWSGQVVSGENFVDGIDDILLLDPADYTDQHITVRDPGGNAGNTKFDIYPWLMGSDGARFYIAQAPGLMGALKSSIKVTAPNSGITWTAADNGSGKIRLTSNAAHGISNTGRKLHSAATQNGWVADDLHEIAIVVDATNIDLTTNYASHGVPVFSLAGDTIALAEINNPILRASSQIVGGSFWEFTGTTNSKRVIVTFGAASGDEVVNVNTTAAGTVGVNRPFRARNKNSTSAQVMDAGKATAAPQGSVGTLTTTALDTSVATKTYFKCAMAAANEYVELTGLEYYIIW